MNVNYHDLCCTGVKHRDDKEVKINKNENIENDYIII